MECRFFGMDWGIAHLHYVITACAAVCLPQEKEAALRRRLKRVHWRGDGRRNARKQWEELHMQKPNSNIAVRALAHCPFAFWKHLVV